MIDNRTSQTVYDIFENLNGLTSQTDLELLCFSLIQSLSSLLPSTKVKVLTLNQQGIPIRRMGHENGKLEIVSGEVTLDSEVKKILAKVTEQNLDTFAQVLDGRAITIYLLGLDREYSSYLVMDRPEALSQTDSYMVKGVLEIYRNFSKLMRNAQTDALTGLSNRKTFEVEVSRINELQMAGMQDSSVVIETRSPSEAQVQKKFWICSIDIDFFKKINDTYGHLYGDEVLMKLAQLMKSEFRFDDLLFRFGGEEFIALVNSPDRIAVEIAIERFRMCVESTDFVGVGDVTVSIGVVAMDPTVFTVTLMDYADQALYHSKRTGRNRTTFFDDLVDQGIAQVEEFKVGGVNFF